MSNTKNLKKKAKLLNTNMLKAGETQDKPFKQTKQTNKQWAW